MNETANSDTADQLVVVINGEAILEYDRHKTLPEQQRAYLQRMDEKMDQGVMLEGQQLASPDQLQRAQFVAVHMVDALQQDNEAHAAASCAYLATRIPDLRQVKVELNETGVHVDLVFDKAYSKEMRVDLNMPTPGREH